MIDLLNEYHAGLQIQSDLKTRRSLEKKYNNLCIMIKGLPYTSRSEVPEPPESTELLAYLVDKLQNTYDLEIELGVQPDLQFFGRPEDDS